MELLISSLSSDKRLWIFRLGNPKLRDPYFLNLSSNVVSCLDPQQQSVWRKCVFLLKSTQSVLSTREGDPHLWISGPSGRPQVCGVCRSSLLTHHKVVMYIICMIFFVSVSLSWCGYPQNVRLSLPQTVGGVFIERLADYLLVKSVFGFSLAWDGATGVYLKMSEEHHGVTCGLCGNFNHFANDDLTTARGKTGLTVHSPSYP